MTETIDRSVLDVHGIAASPDDLRGDLEPYGPRIGADRGTPQTSGRILHASADGSIEVGIWECTPGGWSIEDRPNTETVMILRGRATITDADGTRHELVAGMSLTLPVGWTGRWEIHETLRKVYVTITGR
ncbi:MAG: cupin domain-containing protein [Chloroflexota bacterium]